MVVEDQRKVHIQIQDDGPGMKDEDRVFERFYTGDQSGSGIGLSVSNTIVEKHRGEIKASNNNIGALVVISLPF
ncbi:MAG: HAMP domain-containing sensor histidine kinase [Anaerobacillus sp.]